MRILITGGAGFIGSNIADSYILEGHEVLIVDNLSAGRFEFINSKAHFRNITIQSEKLTAVFEEFQPEIINHHAAHIDLRKSVQYPLIDADTNINGTLNILSHAQKYRVKKIIFASTGGAIYGDPNSLPVNEEYPPKPLSPYGVNKLAAEHYLRVWNELYGLDYTILRYANVFGPRQNPKGEAGVVAIFSIAMIRGVQPVIFGDGSKTRDYVFVGDVVKANCLALSQASKQIINIGNGIQISDLMVFENVKSALDSKLNPIFGEVRPGEALHIALDIKKASSDLKWRPSISFQEGVKQTASFYKANLHLF
jgi:UDP-glucose 4-epimerase